MILRVEVCVCRTERIDESSVTLKGTRCAADTSPWPRCPRFSIIVPAHNEEALLPRAFATQQRDRLTTRGIDITSYGISHLAYRVPEWDDFASSPFVVNHLRHGVV